MNWFQNSEDKCNLKVVKITPVSNSSLFVGYQKLKVLKKHLILPRTHDITRQHLPEIYNELLKILNVYKQTSGIHKNVKL